MRLSRRLRSENVSTCTEAQYGVLASLVHFGPMSPGELAERERVQAPTMTRTVASLEDLGYVIRTKHATDRRQVVVTVTDAGREVVEETKRWRNAWLDENLAGLTAVYYSLTYLGFFSPAILAALGAWITYSAMFLAGSLIAALSLGVVAMSGRRHLPTG